MFDIIVANTEYVIQNLVKENIISATKGKASGGYSYIPMRCHNQ